MYALVKSLLRTATPNSAQSSQHHGPLSIYSWTTLLSESSLSKKIAFSCITLVLSLWAYVKARRRLQHHDNDKPFPQRLMQSSNSAEATDPPLLRKHSEFHAFRTDFSSYPAIRVFYRPHPQAEKIPNEPQPLPLLVFIHGLGGSLSQFNGLMSSLVNVAPCLGIDLPGCGRSKFAPRDWKSYETGALVALLDTVIERYRKAQDGQPDRGVILIAHSMGCSLSVALASTTSPYPSAIRKHVKGLVAICPKAEPPNPEQVRLFRRLLCIPGPLFEVFRMVDRWGGAESKSVRRFVGSEAGIDARKLQLRFNEQSKTPVWRRMAWGTLPDYDEVNGRKGGLPGLDIWKGLDIPLCFIAGEADVVTKPEEVQVILDAMNDIPSPGRPINDSIIPDASQLQETNSASALSEGAGDDAFGVVPSTTERINVRRAPIIRSTVLPAPAAHGLLYDHATYRTVAGLIQDFLSDHICSHLSLGWQLQHLTTSGKWDVKNLAKWQGVAPVSAPIGPPEQPIFRALKTLRKQDEVHTPQQFVADWRDRIFAIVDISHDSPTYDPAELEAGGIQYHKFPTVSKIPPTVQEVQDFISLIERLRAEIQNTYHPAEHTESSENSTLATEKTESNIPIASINPATAPSSTRPSIGQDPVIAVHCHYGYNRTGFFIVCYLVEILGYKLEDAISEFARQRPPGIRHDHFIDSLYVRYTVGLKRPGKDERKARDGNGHGRSIGLRGGAVGGEKGELTRRESDGSAGRVTETEGEEGEE